MKQNFKSGVGLSRNSHWSLLLNSLRQVLRKLKLSVTFHKLRQMIHFGSWRVIPIYFIRKIRPFVKIQYNAKSSLLGSIDASTIANEVRQNSVAVVGVLPSDFVSRLRKITDKLPFGEFQLVHQINKDIQALTEDLGIKSVLGEYLKCEPALLEVSLFVTKPGPSLVPKTQHSFHFDYAGWESLNVFVYLTDVTENSAYHVIARGSHHNRSIGEVLKGPLTVEEGHCKYGSAIQNITGSAGTLFFENTEAFHCRHEGKERRVMLNLLYASHRSLLSHGRASQTKINARNRAFKSLDIPQGVD